jgi:DNA repair ATPase RecN
MIESFADSSDMPSGAKFYRCAFQVNPAHYAGKFRGADHGFDEGAYVAAVLDKCVELGVEVVAVTDHNHAGSIARFKSEGATRGVTVFPGLEVASSEGVHVLCLYAPETSDTELQRFLGQFDITSAEPSSSLSRKSLGDLLACVRDQGGQTIAAHVTHDKGLLNTLHGQARINAWKDPNLLCVQLPGAVDDAPDDKRPILKNQNADYRREPGATDGLAIAVVNACDITKPEDLESLSATCWVKMTEPSLEGLRQAFLDPYSRIRLASDPVAENHAEFRAMTWKGGFLDGCGLPFNENLNVLIGGRGTGKSTVIESLRCVFGFDPLGPDAKKAHDGIVNQVLKNGTQISLLVRVHSPTRRDYLIERTIPNAPVVKDDIGSVLPVSPQDVVPRVQVFGQHEISELTKDPEKLTRLLDRFIGSNDESKDKKADLAQRLDASSREIVRLAQKHAQLQEKLSALPKLEETLKRFQEAGLEEKLKDKSQLVREEQILKTTDERVDTIRDLAAKLRAAVPLDKTHLDALKAEQLPAAETFEPLDAVLTALELAVVAAAEALEKAVADADTKRVDVRTLWDERREAVEKVYEKILRELQKSQSNVDGEEFIRLRRQIESLKPLEDDLTQVAEKLAEAREQRRRLIIEWENAKAAEFRALEKAARKVTKRLEQRVRVRVTFSAVRDGLIALLKERPGGRLKETLDALAEKPDLSLSELANKARAGKDELIATYGLLPAQADRLARADDSVWMEVEELDLPATTSIELNVAPEGADSSWQKLEDLSTGQKATAVLLLLLLDSDAPLVVDQPEDDLDNRFITESVVPRMKEEKRRRQFIFATHNANVPVLGDAELIVGISAKGEPGDGQAALSAKYMGSIDSRGVRRLVEEVLEGGRQAFELRRKKYGF